MSVVAETLSAFSPPANLPELNAKSRKIWSEKFISQWMKEEIAGGFDGPSGKRNPLTQFFNGRVTPYDTTQQPTPIQWSAFPRNVTVNFGGDDDLRWKIADSSRIFQDEYLEWSLSRNPDGKITRVVFTCEGPEYWQFYASVQQEDAIATIKKINDLDDYMNTDDESEFFLAPYDDLDNRSKWLYNPTNRYNSNTHKGTIIHLIQPSNTLSAEVDIAAQATVIRKNSQGKIVTDPDQLIRHCSKYGDPLRNSDPKIGSSINKLAREGNSVSVADPVGLYIYKFDTGNFKLDASGRQNDDPDNFKPVPASWFEFQRGDIKKHQGLRLRIRNNTGERNSDGKLLTVSDIYDKSEGVYVKYGSQFADYITMSVSGVTIAGDKPSPAEFCLGNPEKLVANGNGEEPHAFSAAAAAPTIGRWKHGRFL